MASKKSRPTHSTPSTEFSGDRLEQLRNEKAKMEQEDNLLAFKVLTGDPDAQYILAQKHLVHGDTEKDIHIGMFWLSNAAKLGHKNAQIIQLLYLQRLADKGNADYQYQLAQIYENGVAVNKDEVKAIYWYKKAADQELPAAIFKLAICYLEGNLVPADRSTAINLAIKSANLGHIKSSLLLGMHYMQNHNIAEALGYFETAAAANVSIAKTILDTLNNCDYSTNYTICTEIPDLNTTCLNDMFQLGEL